MLTFWPKNWNLSLTYPPHIPTPTLSLIVPTAQQSENHLHKNSVKCIVIVGYMICVFRNALYKADEKPSKENDYCSFDSAWLCSTLTEWWRHSYMSSCTYDVKTFQKCFRINREISHFEHYTLACTGLLANLHLHFVKVKQHCHIFEIQKCILCR